MNDKSNNLLLWAIGLALIILGFVYFSVGGGQVPTLKVGVITPLSGEAASYGTSVQRAYDIAVSEINASGGVDGKDIELIYEDGKCDGITSTVAAQRLVAEEGVKYILGGTCFSETLAASSVTQVAGVLLLSPSFAGPAIFDPSGFVFGVYPSNNLEARMFADYAMKKENARAAVVSENMDSAQVVREAFKASYTGRIAFDAVFTNETDLSSMVAAMRAANPQMVYVVAQSPALGELILKQIEESGMNVALFASNTMLDGVAFEENPNLYEEIVFAQVDLGSDGKIAQMLASYEAMYGDAPKYLALTAAAYDAAYMLAEAINDSGEDAQAVASYFNDKIVDWPGALGAFNFDDNGDSQLGLSLFHVIGGELVKMEAE